MAISSALKVMFPSGVIWHAQSASAQESTVMSFRIRIR